MSDKNTDIDSWDEPPKRPLSNYFIYKAEKDVIARAREELGEGASVAALTTKISEYWKALSDEDRKVYNDRAAELAAEYKQAVAEYEAKYGEKASSRYAAHQKSKKESKKTVAKKTEKKPADKILVTDAKSFYQKKAIAAYRENNEKGLHLTQLKSKTAKKWDSFDEEKKMYWEDRYKESLKQEEQ